MEEVLKMKAGDRVRVTNTNSSFYNKEGVAIAVFEKYSISFVAVSVGGIVVSFTKYDCEVVDNNDEGEN